MRRAYARIGAAVSAAPARGASLQTARRHCHDGASLSPFTPEQGMSEHDKFLFDTNGFVTPYKP